MFCRPRNAKILPEVSSFIEKRARAFAEMRAEVKAEEDNKRLMKICEDMLQELKNIEIICRIKNIDFVREKLMKLDPTLIKRYININNVFADVYYNCSDYYDERIQHLTKSKLRNVELIIAYRCIMPYNTSKRETLNKNVQFSDEVEVFSSHKRRIDQFLIKEWVKHNSGSDFSRLNSEQPNDVTSTCKVN